VEVWNTATYLRTILEELLLKEAERKMSTASETKTNKDLFQFHDGSGHGY
jgi:hypothetical protein